MEESDEDSHGLNIVEGPLLVEVGYGSLQIKVPHLPNENGLMLVVVPVSPQAHQITSVPQILERDLHI